MRSTPRSVFVRDVLWAGGVAAVFSGIPSTVHAWLTGGDMMAATRAAGAMLLPASADDRALFAAAAVVHGSITLFWAAILAASLPRRHAFGAALVASAAIAVLDLRVIAPAAFPQVYALPFWPQFADHLAWGACVGAVFAWRWRKA